MPDDAGDDGLIRELPRIRRYLRHNAAEDARFGELLKTRLNLPNADLDAAVREATDAVWAKLDCLDCGNCCKNLQIVVDERDLSRLSKKLGLSASEMRKKYVARAEDGTLHFKTSPCPFLGEDNACGVYEDRPQACRDFPYLHAGNFRSRAYVTLENAAICPIAFNVWQKLKARFGKKKK